MNTVVVQVDVIVGCFCFVLKVDIGTSCLFLTHMQITRVRNLCLAGQIVVDDRKLHAGLFFETHFFFNIFFFKA